MTTLQYITLFLSFLSHVALVFFAVYSFFTLFRMERRLRDIDRHTVDTLMFTMQNQIKNSVDMLNDMQRRLRSLVEEEQYETAEQLRAVIESQAKNLRLQIEHMKKTFGDKVDFELHIVGEKNDNKNKND